VINKIVLFSFMAVQIVFAQPFYFKEDARSSLTLSSSYFDLYRGTNSTSKTTAFLQKSFAQFEGNYNTNKLLLLLEAEKNNLRIENGISKVEFNSGQKLTRATVDYEFSFSPFFTELFLRANQITHVSSVDYGGSFGFHNSAHWFEGFRIGFYSYSFPWLLKLKYDDSQIDINNITQSSKIFYEIAFHPLPENRLEFQFEKYISAKNKNENPAFSVKDETNASFALLTITNSKYLPVHITFNHGEGTSFPDLFFAQNSFSTNSIPDLLYNNVEIKNDESQLYRWLPAISVSYNYYKGSIVGNIQSWPFTSVLTSLIANRINYRLTGHIYLFGINAQKRFTFSKFSFKPELSFYQVLPEVTLDTWQPSYLVFGIKDFTRNILPIRKALLGKISFLTTYELNYCSFTLEAGQFIPLKVVKKELPIGETIPGGVVVQAKPGKTDGGRWVVLSMRTSF